MAETVKDPVCLMNIEPKDATHHVEYEGRDYYFCSRACHDEFARSPEQYATMPRRSPQPEQPDERPS